MNQEVLLQFDHVGLAYKRLLKPFAPKSWVLKDISFELYRGEVLGVIGKNGAGKSTLLKLLADIIAPDKGEVIRPKSLNAQMLSLNLGFNPNLSGYDNATMSLVGLGKSIREARECMPAIIEFSGIDELMEYPVKTLSAGEKARLGFSIAMQATPDILLLDEILGVGDKDFRKKSSDALKERVQSNQTAVLVSHQPSVLQQFCNRVLWIENGQVKMLSEAEKVLCAYEKYQANKTQNGGIQQKSVAV